MKRGVEILHDNAHPHTAATTEDLIVTFGCKQFDHPPYSPDLAPSDFHVFLHLNTFVGGIILQRRYTKTGAPLRQVPQQWWKLCQKLA
jgi:histone-lysine N-methyltransferase SETMAR